MKDKKQIRWGIIGCGDVAEVKSGPAFQLCTHSALLAVMRRNGAKAKDFAERHLVRSWYDSADPILEDKAINAVYIATPPSSHLEYALRALEAGKDVYLEKPMVINRQESEALVAAVASSQNKLVVAHYRRHLPMYLKVKELIESNTIGLIKYVDIKHIKAALNDTDQNWRLTPSLSGGGLFHDLAPHQIDLMYYFFGDYIDAKGYTTNQENKHQVSDIVNGIISFRCGVQFRGLWCFDAPDYLAEDSCTIYGSKGFIRFPFYGDTIEVTVDNKSDMHSFETPVHIQRPFIQETINYFLDKRSNPCSVSEGAIVTEIMDHFTNEIIV